MIAWPLAELLPHAGDMILIDGIESFDEEQIHACLLYTSPSPRDS